MLTFLKRQKYRKQVLDSLYAVLYVYPRGRNNIIKDHPRIRDLIKRNFAEGATPERAALLLAAAVLAHLIETLPPDRRADVDRQLRQIDMRQPTAIMSDAMSNGSSLKEVAFETTVLGNAIIGAQTLLDRKQVDQADCATFESEIFGALSCNSPSVRAPERMDAVFDLAMSLPKVGEHRERPPLPRALDAFELPSLSGTEVEVKFVSTPTGIVLVSEQDGQPITEPQRLSQQDLQIIPPGLGVYRFVNLRARSGETHSCIIAGEEGRVFGSMRAFWWSLAKVNVWMADAGARMTRMTPAALAEVRAAAMQMWDAAVKGAHSIDNMRDLRVPFRKVYLEEINRLRIEAENESKRLGLDIALAMVLATQSEDAKLEAHAYQRFKRFLWEAGEEPAEFQEHECAW
jgi:hypothetical protein